MYGTHLSKDAGVSVKKVLVEDGVVVGKGLCEPGQSGGGYFFEGGFVGLMPDSSDIENHPVLRIHVHIHRDGTAAFLRAAVASL